MDTASASVSEAGVLEPTSTDSGSLSDVVPSPVVSIASSSSDSASVDDTVTAELSLLASVQDSIDVSEINLETLAHNISEDTDVSIEEFSTLSVSDGSANTYDSSGLTDVPTVSVSESIDATIITFHSKTQIWTFYSKTQTWTFYVRDLS